MTLDRVRVTNNNATGGGAAGGGVWGAADLTITNSTIDDNDSTNVAGGVGIGTGGRLVMENTTVDNNRAVYAAGVYADLGSVDALSIEASTISNNVASSIGGGLLIQKNTVTGTAFSGSIVNSTISGNSAPSTGGIRVAYNNAVLDIKGTTITDNNNSHVSSNSGGGLRANSAVVTLRSTIVAENTHNSADSDIVGTLTAGTYNLIGRGGAGGLTNGTANNIVLASMQYALLADLGDYGGPTRTHALLSGSPAIDKGSDTYSGSVDQRGLARSYDTTGVTNGADGDSDIGAFESGVGITLIVRYDDDRNSSPDVNALSLREAMALASSLPGPDTIVFDPSLYAAGPHELVVSSTLTIGDGVTIAGPGADKVIIDGDGSSRVFYAPSGTMAIEGVAITNGWTASGHHGAGISNSGNLTLREVVLTDNHAGGYGGGIFHNGTGSTLTMIDSTVSLNTAGYGGGLLSGATGAIVISGSTFDHNEATAGEGGAIYLGGATGGPATIKNSTISTNEAATSAAGIAVAASSAALTVVNSTIAYNQSTTGSGVSGAGIRVFSGSAELQNTIVAENLVGSTRNDVAGGLVAGSSYNLFGVGAGSTTLTGSGNQIGSGGTPIDPELTALDDHGGPTRTHAPIYGSPAIDAGDDYFASLHDLDFDQRGMKRVDDGNYDSYKFVDIGALEVAYDESFS